MGLMLGERVRVIWCGGNRVKGIKWHYLVWGKFWWILGKDEKRAVIV